MCFDLATKAFLFVLVDFTIHQQSTCYTALMIHLEVVGNMRDHMEHFGIETISWQDWTFFSLLLILNIKICTVYIYLPLKWKKWSNHKWHSSFQIYEKHNKNDPGKQTRVEIVCNDVIFKYQVYWLLRNWLCDCMSKAKTETNLPFWTAIWF